MDKSPDILWLNEIRKDDIPSVGGKGASLGEMTSIGLPVPQGFVVTAQAFRKFLQLTKLEDSIFDILEKLNVDDNDALNSTADMVKEMVSSVKMPEQIKKEITASYKKMGSKTVVAVRSSATAEDLPDASFAGQQETYLNILGEEDLLQAVQDCWASLYGARAIYYRAKQGFDDRTVNIAVVVQQLVFSEKAGVMFSSHPISGAANVIMEGSWGLGEAVVSGTVSPDNYVYDRKNKRITTKTIANKSVEIIPDGNKGTKTVTVPANRQDAQVLSDKEVAKLAEFAVISEEHYKIPQDMEWGIVGDTIYILQSRPITTIQKNGTAKNGDSCGDVVSDAEVILQGYGASPGIASGPVVIVTDARDTSRVKEGDVMVSSMTNPDMVPAMRKVVGIITDEGGMTCHAAIVSRELGTPAVVGTKKATTLLKEGQIVTIDGEKGLIYDGKLEAAVSAAGAAATTAVAAAPIITATSVKVNVSMPEAAARAAATGADGVGLLRIEHLIIGMNKTPGWYIKNNKEEEFISELYNGIKTVLDAFRGKPVWVRTIDSPTDEFRNMAGGENEPDEHNPMLGFRGIRRDLRQIDQLRIQAACFKRLWDAGYDNLGIMFPLVQHPREFIAAKEAFRSWGIDVDNRVLGIMVEVPASAIIIDEFIKAGINFCSFGTNDLVQYTLAVDRNNGLIGDMYEPEHPAVMRLIASCIEQCREAGVECSICGQAGSDPKFVKWLVNQGIASVSSNIDAIQKIRETVAKTERQILLNAALKKN
ncbi:phosphoenolpyruvate synthase [Methanorbis furvi]|uniref:Phosphoenolpyruvate synthase n=1 Tax=Methanorbis furvi TaxID=3028299 RepID=A0AAE4SBU3_9EURY|nr:Phosphoenolpyruvate synthase [Methanocorpusculaceae archaeon Ag1]